ncbi:MAG: PIN domain-containing protein [Gemmatimonadota bacterium]|nr:MAG: PIN domain-containing protein [Gemmatimonadota bacterium]
MEPLVNIPTEETVFIDANIFVYHFCMTADSIDDRCTEFLQKVESGVVQAFTSTSVVLETLHRAMIYEATEKAGLEPKGAMHKLQKNPEFIQNLTQYSTIPQRILDFGTQIFTISYQTILDSQTWRENYGLMVNDSITAALMDRNGIKNLATNDTDFDRIPVLHIWKPSI